MYYVLNQVSHHHLQHCGFFLLHLFLSRVLKKTFFFTLKSCFLVSQPPEQWNGGVGFVSKEMIQEHCPAPAPGVKVQVLFCFFLVTMNKKSHLILVNYEQILRCGPPPMNKAMAGHLEAIGYAPDMQFQF